MRSAQADTKSVLGAMQGPIRSMALLHETLYRSDAFAAVDLGAYLKQLAIHVFRAQASRSAEIQLHLDMVSVQVQMDQAMPCGLLVNERFSSCLKHGFPDGRSGEVRVELQALDGSMRLRLRVSDTGIGLPEDFDEKRGTSLGLQLVSDLAMQVGGTLEIGPRPGVVSIVSFAVAQPQQLAS